MAPSGDIYVLENGYGAGTNATNEVSRYDSLGQLPRRVGRLRHRERSVQGPAGHRGGLGRQRLRGRSRATTASRSSPATVVGRDVGLRRATASTRTAHSRSLRRQRRGLGDREQSGRSLLDAGVLQNSFSVERRDRRRRRRATATPGSRSSGGLGQALRRRGQPARHARQRASVSRAGGARARASGGTLYVADTGNGRVARFARPDGRHVLGRATGVRGVTARRLGGLRIAAAATSARTSTVGRRRHLLGVGGRQRHRARRRRQHLGRPRPPTASCNEYDATGVAPDDDRRDRSCPRLRASRTRAARSSSPTPATTGSCATTRPTARWMTSWAVTGVTGVAVSGATVYAAAGTTSGPYTTVGVARHRLGLDRGDGDRGRRLRQRLGVSSSGGVVRKYTSGGTFSLAVGAGQLSTPQGVAVTAGARSTWPTPATIAIIRFSPTIAFQLEWGQYPGSGRRGRTDGPRHRRGGQRLRHEQGPGHDPEVRRDGHLPDALGRHRRRGRAADQPRGDRRVARSATCTWPTPRTSGSRSSTQTGDVPRRSGGASAPPTAQFDTPSGIAIDARRQRLRRGHGQQPDPEVRRRRRLRHAPGAASARGTASSRRRRGSRSTLSGNVWVADTANNRIQEFDAGGRVPQQVGRHAGSSAQDGKFSSPYDLAFDAEGSIWVADRNNYRIQRFTTAGVVPVQARQRRACASAQFNLPSGDRDRSPRATCSSPTRTTIGCRCSSTRTGPT